MFKYSARQLSPLPCVLRQCETSNRLSYLIKIFLPLSLFCRQPSSRPDGFQHPSWAVLPSLQTAALRAGLSHVPHTPSLLWTLTLL